MRLGLVGYGTGEGTFVLLTLLPRKGSCQASLVRAIDLVVDVIGPLAEAHSKAKKRQAAFEEDHSGKFDAVERWAPRPDLKYHIDTNSEAHDQSP